MDAASRRAFVENSVRLCASLRLQLETVQRCVVCLDGARGTVLVPCGHTGLCRRCAVRVAEAPGEARRCPVCLRVIEKRVAVTAFQKRFQRLAAARERCVCCAVCDDDRSVCRKLLALRVRVEHHRSAAPAVELAAGALHSPPQLYDIGAALGATRDGAGLELAHLRLDEVARRGHVEARTFWVRREARAHNKASLLDDGCLRRVLQQAEPGPMTRTRSLLRSASGGSFEGRNLAYNSTHICSKRSLCLATCAAASR